MREFAELAAQHRDLLFAVVGSDALGSAALELDALEQHRLVERQPREERPPSAFHGLRRL